MSMYLAAPQLDAHLLGGSLSRLPLLLQRLLEGFLLSLNSSQLTGSLSCLQTTAAAVSADINSQAGSHSAGSTPNSWDAAGQPGSRCVPVLFQPLLDHPVLLEWAQQKGIPCTTTKISCACGGPLQTSDRGGSKMS